MKASQVPSPGNQRVYMYGFMKPLPHLQLIRPNSLNFYKLIDS